MGALVMLGMPTGIAALMEPKAVSPRRRIDANPSYPMPAGDEVQIDHDNKVILVRWLDRIYAFTLACPDRNAVLRWNGLDEQFHCPRHHAQYQPDGTFISGRATRNMDRFGVSRMGNEILVDVRAAHHADAEAGAWADAVINVARTEAPL